MNIFTPAVPKGAVGATGSTNQGYWPPLPLNGTMASSMANFATSPSLPYVEDLPADLARITREIRPHRRVYERDQAALPSELRLSFLRNRVEVITSAYHVRSTSDTTTIVERYTSWLDDHNTGLYSVDSVPQQFRLVIAFERETDMMQFVLALR